MKVRVFASPSSAARALAVAVAARIREKPNLVLGLPTGRTPTRFYRELISLYESQRVSLTQVTTFNLDEFVGVAGNHPGSYQAFMRRHLFDRVDLSPHRTHLLDGAARDLEAECRRFDRAIARSGGIDFMLLGLGANGHVGFNEPGDALVAETHPTRLTASTRRANASLFGRIGSVPRAGLTMGMATILRARRIVLLVTGASKARMVARTVCGPITPRVPASFLQLHDGAEVWIDQAAASKVRPYNVTWYGRRAVV